MQTTTPPVLSVSHMPADTARRAVLRLGFWSAGLTAVLAALALGIGIMTPVRSGRNCASDCIGYPYTDAAAFVPRDYLWMYPSALMVIAFVVLLASVQAYVPERSKVFGLLALVFATICATVITVDYVIQLAVVQPSLLMGETANLSLFAMYNPHGIYLALEDLGYAMMSISFLFCGLAMAGRSGLEQAVRWLFLAAVLLAIGALILLATLYREHLDDRFEVIVIGINWLALIAGGILLSLIFRRAARQSGS